MSEATRRVVFPVLAVNAVLAVLIATWVVWGSGGGAAELAGLEISSCQDADSVQRCVLSGPNGPVAEGCYTPVFGTETLSDCQRVEPRTDVPEAIWDDVERELASLVDTTSISFYGEGFFGDGYLETLREIDELSGGDGNVRAVATHQIVDGAVGERRVAVVGVLAADVDLVGWSECEVRAGMRFPPLGSTWWDSRFVAWCESASICDDLRTRLTLRDLP